MLHLAVMALFKGFFTPLICLLLLAGSTTAGTPSTLAGDVFSDGPFFGRLGVGEGPSPSQMPSIIDLFPPSLTPSQAPLSSQLPSQQPAPAPVATFIPLPTQPGPLSSPSISPPSTSPLVTVPSPSTQPVRSPTPAEVTSSSSPSSGSQPPASPPFIQFSPSSQPVTSPARAPQPPPVIQSSSPLAPRSSLPQPSSSPPQPNTTVTAPSSLPTPSTSPSSVSLPPSQPPQISPPPSSPPPILPPPPPSNCSDADFWNWKDYGAVFDIRDQGRRCSSSWAFSAVAAIEGIWYIRTGRQVLLSEQQFVDCDYYNGGCRSGWPDRAFRYAIRTKRLTKRSRYPYRGVRRGCRRRSIRSVARIRYYSFVPRNNENELRAAVRAQPVSVGIDARQLRSYTEGIYKGPCGYRPNHAMTAIGYGCEESTGLKFWILKNSWGLGWGEFGYMRLLRGHSDSRGLCGVAMRASYPDTV